MALGGGCWLQEHRPCCKEVGGLGWRGPPAALPPTGCAAAALLQETGAEVAQHRRAVEQTECSQCLQEAVRVLQATSAAAAPGLDPRKALLPLEGSSPGEALVRCAEREGAAVLVVGSSGRGALQSAALSLVGLGSVSSYCLHHAPCPVAVVRDRQQQQQQQQQRQDQGQPPPVSTVLCGINVSAGLAAHHMLGGPQAVLPAWHQISEGAPHLPPSLV